MLSASDAKAATADILKDELLLDECRRALPAISRLCAHCGQDGVYVCLQPLIILFGAPDFGKATAALLKTWVELYGDALGHLPRESLECAVSDWIANGKPFFPKPSELKALGEKHAAEVWKIAYRVRAAVTAANKEAPAVETPEERARGLAMARETLAILRSGRGLQGIPRPARPQGSQHEVAERIRAGA